MPDRPSARVELEQSLRAAIDAPSPVEFAPLLADSRAEDIAAILGEFEDDARLRIFRAVPAALQAEVLDETEEDSQELILERLRTDELAPILASMPPDEAADLIDLVPEAERETLLDAVGDGAGAIRDLLQYAPDSAGGIMTSDVLTVGPEATAREILEYLQETIDAEVVNYVYVVDARRHLLGVVSIREVLGAEPEDPARAFMTRELISAHYGDDQESVANLAREYNLSSIPVVDDRGRLLGVATIDDLIDVLSEEAHEDFSRLAGTESGERPTQQRVLSRALARVPWLLLPGMSGFVVAGLIEGQGDQDRLRLWSFLPLVMGISGAVGTQASTILVRGIATGEIERGRVRRVWGQEFLIGALVNAVVSGLVVGSLFVAHRAGLVDCAASLPVAVGLGLAFGILLATTSGTVLPFVFRLFKIDPALAAGPFITSLNDVLAASSFLWIGHQILAEGAGS